LDNTYCIAGIDPPAATICCSSYKVQQRGVKMNTNINILKALLLKYIQILNTQAVFVFLDHQKDKKIVKETLPAILLYNTRSGTGS